MKNNRGQVGIWVIIGLVIFSIVLVIFVLNKNPILHSTNENSVDNSVEKCIRDAANEAVDKMLPQGGFIEPSNYQVYNNIKVSYLCQNIGYYSSCINQHPALLNEEKKEIKNYISPITENCFENMKKEMEKKNYVVDMKQTELNVSLSSNKISIDVKKDITLKKNENVQKFSDYHIEIVNPLYDLSNVAMTIANEQARYCYFEYVGYMILYPRFDIKVFSMSDSTRIYTIADKKSKKEMNIATRSCAIPGGI